MDAFFSLSWTEWFLSNSSFVPTLLCCKDLAMSMQKSLSNLMISQILSSSISYHKWTSMLDSEELSIEFSVLSLISLIKFWFTAVVTWICLTAECWFNKKRTVMMDSDSNIRNRSNIHCKYPVIVYLYLFWPQRSQPMVTCHTTKYHIDSDLTEFNCAHYFQKSPKNHIHIDLSRL